MPALSRAGGAAATAPIGLDANLRGRLHGYSGDANNNAVAGVQPNSELELAYHRRAKRVSSCPLPQQQLPPPGNLERSAQRSMEMFKIRSARRRRFFVAATLACALGGLFPAGPSAAADPVQARKDIKAMGIEYTAPDFAKAAGNGDMVAVRLFIDAGMDVNSGGGAAIGLAAGRGQTKMVQYLLSKGAKPTSDALQFARTRGHPDIEKILLDAGAKK